LKNRKVQSIIFALLASLTLGLAPFKPEPHVVQKWRWLMDGAVGMNGMDWFDLVLHTLPFVFLVYTIFDFIRFQKKTKQEELKQK